MNRHNVTLHLTPELFTQLQQLARRLRLPSVARTAVTCLQVMLQLVHSADERLAREEASQTISDEIAELFRECEHWDSGRYERF